MALQLSIPKGRSKDFSLIVKLPDGTTATGVFTTGYTLVATVWKGNDTAAIIHPTATWVDAPNGSLKLAFQDADTASLEFGVYDWCVDATFSGRTGRIAQGTILVTETAGTTAARPTYCELSDLLKYAPWINDIQYGNVVEGFADQRADAREWYDGVVLRCFRSPGFVGMYGAHSQAIMSFGAGSRLGKSKWLTDALAANQLMVLPEVKRLNAYYAIYLVCGQQINRGGSFASEKGRFYNLACSEIFASTAQLDTSGSGYYSVAIPLGVGKTLFT